MQSISMYGDLGADDPFAESDLAIMTTAAPLLSDPLLSEEGGGTVDVRGHDGLVTDQLPFATTVQWEEAEGLRSASLRGPSTWTSSCRSPTAWPSMPTPARSTSARCPAAFPAAGAGRIRRSGRGDVRRPWNRPAGARVDRRTRDGLRARRDELFGNAFVAEISGDAADLAILRWASGATTVTEYVVIPDGPARTSCRGSTTVRESFRGHRALSPRSSGRRPPACWSSCRPSGRARTRPGRWPRASGPRPTTSGLGCSASARAVTDSCPSRTWSPPASNRCWRASTPRTSTCR